MAYTKAQFIAWGIHTAPKVGPTTETYLGLSPPSLDIAERVKLVGKAIETARAHPATKQAEAHTLKIVLLPEFFFRGTDGAYGMDEVQELVSALQDLVKDTTKWRHWLFAFGSILGKSYQTKPGATGGPKYVIDTSKPVEAYNYCLVQKGGFGDAPGAGPAAAHAILKQKLSGIDFIRKASSSGGMVLERVRHLEPMPEFGSLPDVQMKEYDGASVFRRDGITFGLELCLDHLAGRLKNSKGLPPIDIQLVPSCGAYIKDSSVVARNGGYVFGCDGFMTYDRDTVVPGYSSGLRRVGTGSITGPAAQPVDATGVRINEIYALGAGEIRIYPEQALG